MHLGEICDQIALTNNLQVQATCVDCCWDGPYFTARRVDDHTRQSWNPKCIGGNIEKYAMGNQNDFLPGKGGYLMCTENSMEALSPLLYTIFVCIITSSP